MKTITSLLLALSLGATSVLAQDDDGFVRILSVGLHGGYGIASHSASFTALPNVPDCCPEYTGGSGGGLIMGVDVGLPVAPKIDVTLRLGYQSFGGTMTTDEPIAVRVNNDARQTALRHTLETTVNTIIIEPGIEYRIDNLGLMGGIRLGLASSGTYSTQEAFADPTIPWTYQGGASTYLPSSGSLTNVAGMQLGLMLGVRYHLTIASALQIVPEVSYAPALSGNVQDIDWTTSAIRFGVGISYQLTRFTRLGTPILPGDR
jgi:hypothetical protein